MSYKQNRWLLGNTEALYLGSYILLILTTVAFQDVFYKPRAVLLMCLIILSFLCFGCVIYSHEKTNTIMLKVVVFVSFALAAYFNNKPLLVVFAILICCSNQTSFERIIETNFLICGCSILVIPILSKIGILPTNHFFRDNGIEAHAFGFGYYQVVPYTFFFMILEYFYLNQVRNRKLSWLELIIILAINYGIYFYSTLRLTYYLGYLVIIMYVILIKLNWFDLRRRWITLLTLLLYPALMMFTIFLNTTYDRNNPVMSRLNYILSNRLYLGNLALKNYPVRLFGQTIQTNNSSGINYFYIDSGYLYSLIGYGVILTVIILIMYSIMCLYSMRNNDKALFIWLVAVALFTFSNNVWISLSMNPLLLGIFSYRVSENDEVMAYHRGRSLRYI